MGFYHSPGATLEEIEELAEIVLGHEPVSLPARGYWQDTILVEADYAYSRRIWPSDRVNARYRSAIWLAGCNAKYREVQKNARN